jgi:hypothetical protein
MGNTPTFCCLNSVVVCDENEWIKSWGDSTSAAAGLADLTLTKPPASRHMWCVGMEWARWTMDDDDMTQADTLDGVYVLHGDWSADDK